MSVSFLSRVLLGLVLTAQAWAFDEGIDYTRLLQPQPTETGDKVEVLEVFWYGCPHCWHLEPALSEWLKSLPEGAEFRRMPATGGRWDAHARAFYAAQAMGKLETFHQALFRAIHEEKRPLMTEDELVDFAGEIGLDKDEFRADFNSFLVETELRKAQEMSKRYGIDGVPAIIVNGQYRTGPSQAGGQARMFQVLDSLLTQELRAGS
ncbi:thiol:disulfide interchange protein DsbA/DsbL [Thiorhodococcus mannitoliphagus]|uniref:Thiol:disulfide interchange protein n=1 Tax=Thiorhodococcus mannitoliphagus TaxID=329406 RepID=A0A6P1E351_9GAMM|nr:thiol:disulfide interchange protein DsbA/DsbL [Thiorhodococcus mannitoliphagus]NEX22115.1 thiol:disulfide interchange protein DsbA/DsbL [Thiorhodococcus mannitoliphagus]